MMSKNDNSLEALRQILLQDDLTKLQKLEDDLFDLQQTIADKESLIASLDPIIAELLERKIAVSKDEMAAALAPIMGEAIRLQVTEAKDDVIDALYPVIGKVIRKSVAESMKKFVDSMNQKIEQALRNRLFKKRVQSKLTGIPESQLILKDVLPFKIEEIFLIHKESGLLISHVSSQETEVKVNEEMISGMLTAIRDFVAEAFVAREEGDLDEIQIGGNKILLEMGRCFYFAFVISGFPPANFQDEVRKLGRRIHNRFYKFFRQFNGEMTNSGDITKYLSRFYEKFKGGTAQKAPAKSYLIYLLLLLSLLTLAFFAVRYIPGFLSERRLRHSIETKLDSIPELRRQNIECRLSNGWLTVSGNVPSMQQIKMVDSVSLEIQGIKGVQNRLVISDQNTFAAEVMQQINQTIARSEHLRHVTLRFIIEGAQVIIEGEAPNLQVKRDIGFLASEVDGIRSVINNLKIREQAPLSLDEIRTFLRQQTICFNVNDAKIPDDQTARLDAVLHSVQNLNDVKLVIKGYSDNSSTPEYNLNLSQQRAVIVAEYLKTKNYPLQQIVIEYFGIDHPVASNETEEGRAQNRRVEFDVLKER